MTDLAGRRALVTGASGGLGREIASALARAGAHVIVQGRHAADLHMLSRAIALDGGSCGHVASDLRTPQAAAELAARGAVQILVNNAGARDRRSIAEPDRASVRELLDVNLVAPFELARAFASGMSAGERIINVSSIAGQVARAGDAAYTMSKGGLDALNRALAAELRPRQITVDAVAPGFFATPANADMAADPAIAEHLARRTSLGRWGRHDEIAGAVLFFASPASPYVTGQVLAVDGGHVSHF